MMLKGRAIAEATASLREPVPGAAGKFPADARDVGFIDRNRHIPGRAR